MCNTEDAALQRGMNYGLHKTHSVLLMSRRDNAPYSDEIRDEGRELVYEGHDTPRRADSPDPKTVDQPLETPSGGLTQNGKFWEAAKARGATENPLRVRVYEKVLPGVWVFNGLFMLRDAWQERSNGRMVCKFLLHLTDEIMNAGTDSQAVNTPSEHNRMIPSKIKREVWERDQGRCRLCGESKDLHFDHIIPFSRGGTSTNVENIQLLCASCNLSKSDRIE